MQFEYEPELLIEAVKKRPCIWDHEHQEFRSKQVRKKRWIEIVKELMSIDTKELSKSELRELGNLIEYITPRSQTAVCVL